MALAIEAIRNARSPFEQYHPLRLARRMLDSSSAPHRWELYGALMHPQGVPIHDSDASRTTIRDDLLSRLPAGKILAPERRAQITQAFTVKGSLSAIPPDCHVMIAVQISGLFWPKDPELPAHKQTWQIQIRSPAGWCGAMSRPVLPLESPHASPGPASSCRVCSSSPGCRPSPSPS